MIGEQADLKALIRTVPDFPKPGIQFRDITTCCSTPPASRRRSSGSPSASRTSRT
jgi:adenine phosphoribosyltransferase